MLCYEGGGGVQQVALLPYSLGYCLCGISVSTWGSVFLPPPKHMQVGELARCVCVCVYGKGLVFSFRFNLWLTRGVPGIFSGSILRNIALYFSELCFICKCAVIKINVHFPFCFSESTWDSRFYSQLYFYWTSHFLRCKRAPSRGFAQQLTVRQSVYETTEEKSKCQPTSGTFRIEHT